MIFFYKERAKCKNQKPRRRTTSLTVWGICPVDECFKRPPREMHPHIRGEVSPILPAWGGCQSLLQSSQKPPVKVALSKLHQQDHHHRFITQPKPRGNWRGMKPSPSLKPKPILGCCIRTRLLCIMHAYLHARSDHSNPKHPHHHPTAATLDPPNALCLESDKSSQPKRLFYVKRSNRILHMQKGSSS
jgi:hypothetical protein